MNDADRSNQQLMAELRELRSRRAAYSRLCGFLLEHVFFIERISDGTFRFYMESPGGPTTTREGLPSFLSAALIEEKSRQVLDAGQPVQYEDEQDTPEGLQVWRVYLVPAPETDGTLRLVIGSALEVTDERYRAVPPGAATPEVTSMHPQLADLLPDPVIFSDVAGRLLYVNAAAVALMGASGTEELIGRSIWELIHPEDRVQAQAHAQDLRQKGRAERIEYRLVRLDGQVIPVDTSSVPVPFQNRPAALSVVRDISDRKRAAASERESRSLFYKIFHASPAGITITSMPEGRFLEVNQAWCDLTGFAPGEVSGRTAPELGLWTDPDQHARLMQRLSAEGSLRDFELGLRTRAGARRTVLYSAQQIQVKGKSCMLTVVSDITERKQAELALVEAKEQAEEMARIKTAFLTNMTHEVRTPLTVILGFTSMLRQGVRKEYQRFVRVIERSGRRLLLMLDSVLDLAQLEAGTVEVNNVPFNVVDLLQNVATELRPLAEEKGLTFELALPASSIYACIDHKIVTRVLNNLLDNAIKFTEQGRILLSAEEGEGQVVIRIRDTGIGIDQHFLPYIFNEFTQESTGLERTHQGSGLGLTVSKRLVELTGGSIQVESRKGEGSLFTLSLPAAPPK